MPGRPGRVTRVGGIVVHPGSGLPTVTVCIPTYERPEMLRQSLQSVLWQSYGNLEVIVSDNASRADNASVVESFGDPRVRYERLESNVGLFGNFTRCLRLGSGQYRAILPDDDLLLPGSVQARVAFLQAHPDVGMVHTGFRYLDDNGLPNGPVQNWTGRQEPGVQSGRDFIRQSIGHGGITCVSSVMVRSDIVHDESYQEDDGPYCDLALWLRLALRADVGFLPGPLAGLRLHAASASSRFQVVTAHRGGKTRRTGAHADALRLAHGRFIDRLSDDASFADELAGLLAASDRRLRVAIAAHRWLPEAVLTGAKRAIGWRPGGTVYRALSVYATDRHAEGTGVHRRGRRPGPGAAGASARAES